MLRLASTYEPPAEEADQTTHNDYYCYRDPRDHPAAEASLVDRWVRGSDGWVLGDVTCDGAGVAGWRGAACTAPDALDTPVVSLAGRAGASS